MSDRSSIGVIVAGVFPRVRKMYTLKLGELGVGSLRAYV